MKMILIAAMLLTSTLSAQSPETPKNMKKYFLGLFVSPEKPAPAASKEEREALLQKHLAYIGSQVAAGKYSLAGPLLDNDRIRGILIINVATVEEAKTIVSGDPMVLAGRLGFEL